MKPIAQHLILDIRTTAYNAPVTLTTMLREVAKQIGARVLHEHVETFSNGAVTIVLVLAESHIVLHQELEHDTYLIDIMTCRGHDPAPAIDICIEWLSPYSMGSTRIDRGRQ